MSNIEVMFDSAVANYKIFDVQVTISHDKFL